MVAAVGSTSSWLPSSEMLVRRWLVTSVSSLPTTALWTPPLRPSHARPNRSMSTL